MTRRIPCFRSEKSSIEAMPVSRLACTWSLTRSMIFSGPTRYGSSVTTMPRRRAVMFSNDAVARVRKVPRPVS